MKPNFLAQSPVLIIEDPITVEARKLEHGFRRISARILILYLKRMRIVMFQLSGYYCM